MRSLGRKKLSRKKLRPRLTAKYLFAVLMGIYVLLWYVSRTIVTEPLEVESMMVGLRLKSETRTKTTALPKHEEKLANDNTDPHSVQTKEAIVVDNSKISDSSNMRDVKAPNTRKWAYAFLVGNGGAPEDEGNYFSGLCSVVAIAYELRKLGSEADFVAMVQMSTKTPHTKLQEYEEELLLKNNIRIAYVPKYANPHLERFYSLMMEKFRILEFEDYSRVMYLDYDIFPNCNLDYLFELSDTMPDASNGTSFRLKENVILGYRGQPSAGGIFILKPNSTDFGNLRRIIHEKEIRSFNQPYPHWDEVYGWGHVITPPDYWKNRWKKEQNWTWYGVEADQGLLYYWTKYVKKSVSIIGPNEVEQWDSDNWDVASDGKLVLREGHHGEGHITTTITKDPFKRYGYGCRITHDYFHVPKPYDDFYHLTGRAKPWHQTQEKMNDPEHCAVEKFVGNLRGKLECEKQVEWYRSLKQALLSTDHLGDFPWDRLFKDPKSVKSKFGKSPNRQVSAAVFLVLYFKKHPLSLPILRRHPSACA